MTLPLVKVGGWAYRDIVTSPQIDALQTNITYACDIRLGQTAYVQSNVSMVGTFNVNTLPSEGINIGISTQTSNTTCYDVEINGQAPYASATGSNRNPGNIDLELQLPVSGGSYPHVYFFQDTNTFLDFFSDASHNAHMSANTLNLNTSTNLNLNTTSVTTLTSGSVVVSTGTIASTTSSTTIFNSATNIQINTVFANIGLCVGNNIGQLDFTNGSGTTPLVSMNISSGFALTYPSTAGTGALSSIKGQDSSGTGLVAGSISFASGNGTGGTSNAGNINLLGGIAAGSGAGGNIIMNPGISSTGSWGGVVIGQASAPAWNSGKGIIFISNATAAPVSAPSFGMYMWVDSGGSLKVQFPGGAIKTVTVS